MSNPALFDYESRPLVYVAAPYTEPDPVQNTHFALTLASRLLDDGLVTPVVPHLTLLWHVIEPRPVGHWYAYDLAIVKRCDAVLRAPGASTGADQEIEFAKSLDIPVFDNQTELYEWARAR